MYIKKVIIQGFGSYNKAENQENFGPGVNAILGVNGSGKSNFFKAIQFVLSPKYMRLDEEKMKDLFHKGRHEAVSTARVDIVFDNSDERFPIESNEVIIRRTINGSNDSFYVNNKLYTKNEMESFLETAGFSRDNPYYMVEQGSVKRLCELSDSGRLELLLEIAGIRVYDDRRHESESVLEDTRQKTDQINDLIKEMNTSLKELSTEMETLDEYDEFDRQRRICIYFLTSADMREKEDEINACNVQRKSLADELDRQNTQYINLHSSLKESQDAVAALELDDKAATDRAMQLEDERVILLKEVTTLELDVAEMNAAQEQGKEREETAKQDASRLQGELIACQQQLEEVTPQLALAESQFDAAESSFVPKQQQLETQRHRHRLQQFATPAERAAFLEQEMAPLLQDVEAKQERVSSNSRQLESVRTDANAIERSLQEKRVNKEAMASKQQQMRQRLQEVHASLEAVVSQRKQLWRQKELLSSDIEKKTLSRDKENSSLNHLIPRDTRDGLDGLMASDLNDPSIVFGPVINLFRPQSDAYIAALETTAGGRLFQVAVKDDEVAAKIVDWCKQKNAGRLTLLPVEQLRREKEKEKREIDGCTPLVDHVICDETFRPIMNLVFGNTMLCDDLQKATEIATRENINCVTLAGEKVGKRGAMRGGYTDSRSSRLRLFRSVQRLNNDLHELESKREEQDSKLKEVNRELDLLTEETQITTQSRLTASALVCTIKDEREAIDRLQRVTTRRDQITLAVVAAESALRAAKSRVEAVQRELTQPDEVLDADAMTSLETEVEAEETICTEKRQTVDRLRLERVRLDTRLTMIRKQLLDLEQNGSDSSSNILAEDGGDAKTKSASLSRRRADLVAVTTELDQIASRRVELSQQRESMQSRANSLQDEDMMCQNAMNGVRNRIAELVQRRNNAAALLEEKRQGMSAMSSIPAGAETYRHYSRETLKRKLNEVNKKLQKYGKVNRKAANQFAMFNDRRKEFEERQKELKEGTDSITELIATLDERKNEAINRTIKQVNTNFGEAFNEMVPRGHAEVTLTVTAGNESYSGIEIKVKFGDTDVMRMDQLSGGQKAVVSLALIFAIQRSDPAPFYLMDEIDAELDTQYREMVAKLILKQAQRVGGSSQIFCTTFKPQVLEVADNFYRITMRNEASRIEQTTKEEAMEFVNTRLSAATGAGVHTDE